MQNSVFVSSYAIKDHTETHCVEDFFEYEFNVF
jgi:hypothetical protein